VPDLSIEVSLDLSSGLWESSHDCNLPRNEFEAHAFRWWSESLRSAKHCQCGQSPAPANLARYETSPDGSSELSRTVIISKHAGSVKTKVKFENSRVIQELSLSV